MAVGTGLFAIVAADTQILVDQQHVGRFADPVVDQELRRFGVHVDRACETVFAAFDEGVDFAAAGHVCQRAFAQSGVAIQQGHEARAWQANDL